MNVFSLVNHLYDVSDIKIEFPDSIIMNFWSKIGKYSVSKYKVL